MLFGELDTFWINSKLRKYKEEQANNYLNVDVLISNNLSITRGHNFKSFKPHTLQLE